MARRSLPPGFRFHPTDVELIMYYLKRKITGKKLHFEAISEVNIYKFSPSDLPDKSCLKSKDLEWFFFCRIERKYSSGVRVKRATENGYWKTTGKDRPIHYNEKTVGTVKTLVFHLGHAPKGKRTDWVIHEYRIIDDQLGSAGIQDTFVLCKVFEKSGPGPKNGAQYGANFNETDWTDDEDDGAQNQTISLRAEGPRAAELMLAEKQSSVVIEPFDLGDTSDLTLAEEGHQPYAGSLLNESDNEITNLLSMFTDEPTFLYENGKIEDGLNDKGKGKILPGSDGFDIYNDLGDLKSWGEMSEGSLNLLDIQQVVYSLNDTLLQDDVGYIELNDLDANVIRPDLSALGDVVGSHDHEIMQPFRPSEGYTGLDHCGSSIGQIMTLPGASNNELNCLGGPQRVNDQSHYLSDAAYAFGYIQRPPDYGVPGHFIQDAERGRYDTR